MKQGCQMNMDPSEMRAKLVEANFGECRNQEPGTISLLAEFFRRSDKRTGEQASEAAGSNKKTLRCKQGCHLIANLALASSCHRLLRERER